MDEPESNAGASGGSGNGGTGGDGESTELDGAVDATTDGEPVADSGTDAAQEVVEPPPRRVFVRIDDATISPFPRSMYYWDGTSTPSTADEDALQAALVADDPYTAVTEFLAQQSRPLWSEPEPFGWAEVGGLGVDPIRDELASATDNAEDSLQPVWLDSIGWEHVPLSEEVEILVSIFDEDVEVHDGMAFVRLFRSDLEDVLAAGGFMQVPVADRSGGRVLFLGVAVTEEPDADATLLPKLSGEPDVYADPVEIEQGRTHSLYVHGLRGNGVSDTNPPQGWTYWDESGAYDLPQGVNPVAVNYDGRAFLAVSNPTVRFMFDTYCRGNDICYVACHSAGCAQTGYALDTEGQGGLTWNIVWVRAIGSAEGGSERADDFSWLGVVGDLGLDLRTETMRALYDHDNIGVEFFMYPGAEADASLPGQDDTVVAYHSAAGMRSAGAYCNPSDVDPACTNLAVGDDSTSSDAYDLHTVEFLDIDELYDHTSVRALLVEDMKNLAQ